AIVCEMDLILPGIRQTRCCWRLLIIRVNILCVHMVGCLSTSMLRSTRNGSVVQKMQCRYHMISESTLVLARKTPNMFWHFGTWPGTRSVVLFLTLNCLLPAMIFII